MYLHICVILLSGKLIKESVLHVLLHTKKFSSKFYFSLFALEFMGGFKIGWYTCIRKRWIQHWVNQFLIFIGPKNKTGQIQICLQYCKTLIIRVRTLFSRNHRSSFIHETLFARLVISSSIILTSQIIGEDFIFASLCSREFTRK